MIVFGLSALIVINSVLLGLVLALAKQVEFHKSRAEDYHERWCLAWVQLLDEQGKPVSEHMRKFCERGAPWNKYGKLEDQE